ncbi:uncharacterized protein LOC134071473 [Sardina pilchardus]|uniref:uncharacterized protein LOC134071473 n=1 Tax=Sardina pilchardus TaxID=27697 RepID=UPI002E14E7E1
MWIKCVTLFVLLATLRCSQGCSKRKRVLAGCNLATARIVTKNMMGTIDAIKISIPDDNIHVKLLTNFTKPCKKMGVDLPVIIDILDIYKTYIFSNMDEKWLIKLENLQDALEHCVFELSEKRHSKNRLSDIRTEKNIRKIEDLKITFKKLEKPSTDFYKALLEFKTVLVWLDMFKGSEETRRSSAHKNRNTKTARKTAHLLT